MICAVCQSSKTIEYLWVRPPVPCGGGIACRRLVVPERQFSVHHIPPNIALLGLFRETLNELIHFDPAVAEGAKVACEGVSNAPGTSPRRERNGLLVGHLGKLALPNLEENVTVRLLCSEAPGSILYSAHGQRRGRGAASGCARWLGPTAMARQRVCTQLSRLLFSISFVFPWAVDGRSRRDCRAWVPGRRNHAGAIPDPGCRRGVPVALNAATVTLSSRARSTQPVVFPVAVPLVVALLTFTAFVPALSSGFVSWDDDRNFLTNPSFRGLGMHQLTWMWSTFHLGHYVPLSWMTLGLDYVVWGMNPTGYHLTNLLLHASDAVLVYFVALRLVERSLSPANPIHPRRLAIASAFAALVFSVHPLRVESVAWITERRDVLSCLFYLSSALLYLRAVDAGAEQRRSYWLSVIAFACALLSKATAVTLPVILLLLNVFPLRRLEVRPGRWWSEAARSVYREILPFALLAAGTVVMTFIALPHLPQLRVAQKVAVSSYSVAFYVWKTVLPSGLAPLYSMPPTIDPFATRYLVSYAVLFTLTAGAWIARTRLPIAAIAWFSFLVAILPMLGLVQNGPQIAADRYTYFAAPYLGIPAAVVLMDSRRTVRLAAMGIGATIIVVLCLLTWDQTTVWHDSQSLWTRVLAVDRDSPIAHNNMGNVVFEQKRFDAAIRHYRTAIAMSPGYAEAHNNLGVALSRQSKYSDAIAEYQRAIAARPTYDEAYDNWGVSLAAQGQAADAVARYQQAIAINPMNADAQVNWGNALLLLGNVTGAIYQYSVALSVSPDNADAWVNWGVALARQGKLAEAILKFRRALELRPDHPEGNEYLQKSLAVLRAQPDVLVR